MNDNPSPPRSPVLSAYEETPPFKRAERERLLSSASIPVRETGD
jgi:hypothetical protein